MKQRVLYGLVVWMLSCGLARLALAQTTGWEYPTTSSYTASSADNGKILASDNVPGATITVTLPSPVTVGQGWEMGFSNGGGHGITINAPISAHILSGQKTFTSFTSPSNTNFEYFAIQSDGTNFRLLVATTTTALFNGIDGAAGGLKWEYLFSTGYAATLTDNGMTMSTFLAGGDSTITLPSTPLIPNGWTIGVYTGGNNAAIIQPNGVSGGTLIDTDGNSVSSLNIPGNPVNNYVTLTFDGAAFRVTSTTYNSHLGVFDNKTGSFGSLQEGAAVLGQSQIGITAHQIADWVFCDCSDPVSYDSVRGVGILTPGSTLDLVNGVAGYVMSQAVKSGPFPTSVALFGMGIADVDNAAVWGLNTALSDNRGLVPSMGTGRQLYNELDFNVTKTSTSVGGLMFGGGSVAQPSSATAITFSSLDQSGGNIAKWTQLIFSFDGASHVFATVGAKEASGASINGQDVNYVYYNSASSREFTAIALASNNTFAYSNTEGFPTILAGVQIVTPDTNVTNNATGIKIGLFSGTAGSGGTPTTGLPASKPSQTTLMSYTDSSGTEQAMGLQSIGGDVPTIALFSSKPSAYLEVGTSVYGNWPSSCIGQPHNTIWNDGSGNAKICP
ncbi:MAG TPA: hypothetical protein VH280_04935 [Verrucomicrobiae bacterium]|nr:hypothetical protein [Verrucomicrobiae bacterium]